MPEKQQFDPRRAALYHAGRSKAPTTLNPDMSDLASAIACGLVYVGDQLAALNGALDEHNLLDNRLGAIVGLLETLDASVTNGLAAIADEL